MKRFAFIIHPYDLLFFADGFNDPGIKTKRQSLVTNVMKWLPPFRRSVVTGIKSKYNGEEIVGDIIAINLLPEHIMGLPSDFVFSKLLEAARLAEKLEDNILGLGAYVALIGNRGLDLSENINIPITTGTTYTIAVIPEIIEKALSSVDKNLDSATITIFGATTTIGRFCCERLLGKCTRLYLIARDYEKLCDLYANNDFYVPIDKDDIEKIKHCIRNTDLILTASGTLSKKIDLNMVQRGTVIYDATYPKSIKLDTDRTRKDILFVDGEAIRPPGRPDFHFSFGFSPGLAYACMAETMLLTFENRFENYSIGKKIDFAKIDEISNLADKHGFKLEGFTRGGKVIDDRKIKEVKLVNSR